MGQDLQKIIRSEELKTKYPIIKELTDKEQKMLFVMMSAFQDAAQQTIFGGEELLKMCDGCAFKKGTEANSSPLTTLVAAESILKEEPFYCHKRFCQNGEEKLCNGWINIMNNR
jgi:hypothetical protein